MDVQIAVLKRYEGAFRVCATSGLITAVAAGTATAGHLFAMRWNPPQNPSLTRNLKWCAIQRIRAHWRTVAGFTAAQEVGLDLSVLRGYSGSHSGGTALTPFTTTNQQKRAGTAPSAGINAGGMFPSQMADMRIAGTGALTAGTHVFDPFPISQDGYAELAAAATVPKGRFDVEFLNADQPAFPLVLAPNEGLCIRNTVLMGAGGAVRLTVEVDWFELNNHS